MRKRLTGLIEGRRGDAVKGRRGDRRRETGDRRQELLPYVEVVGKMNRLSPKFFVCRFSFYELLPASAGDEDSGSGLSQNKKRKIP